MLSFISPTIIVSVLVPVLDGDPVESERKIGMSWAVSNLLVNENGKDEKMYRGSKTDAIKENKIES